MRRPLLFPLLCCLGLLAPPSTSEAQPQSSDPAARDAQPAPGQPSQGQSAPSDAQSDKARKLYLEGVTASAEKRWADAHASFIAAWALYKHYTILGGLGTCELMMGRYRDAAQHLAAYVREIEKDATATPQDRAAAAATYAEARTHVGAVIVSANVPGAEVLVDGALVGTTPLVDPVFLEPGSHTITVRHHGYPPTETAVNVAAGSEIRSAFELERRAASAPPPSPAPPAPPRDAGGPRVGWVVAGSSAAAAGAIAGVVFTLLANGKASAERTQWNVVHGIAEGTVNCTRPGPGNPARQCEKLNALVDDKDLFSNIALWSFVGAGAAVAGTIGYGLASWSSTPERAHVRIVPLVSAGAGGIVAGGVF